MIHTIDADHLVVETPGSGSDYMVFQTWRKIDGKLRHVGHTLSCASEETRDETLERAKGQKNQPISPLG